MDVIAIESVPQVDQDRQHMRLTVGEFRKYAKAAFEVTDLDLSDPLPN